MSQLMFAENIRRRCRQPVAVEGYNIPEWGLCQPVTDITSSIVIIGSHLTRATPCRLMIDAFKPRLINLDHPIFRVGNYGKPEDFLPLFPDSGPSVAIPDDCLLIHIRAGDVATLTNDRYGPLPIRYYEYLIKKTGLRPVFIGEPGRHEYFDLLKTTFPQAEMIGGASAIADFQIIRNARTVALSVSSFCWMAAFLSTRVQQIHLPLAGHFDPIDDPFSDFLPVNDSRYVFHNVCRKAWSERYDDPTGPRNGYSVANKVSVRALKNFAFLRTAKQSAKLHGGLLTRMAGLRDYDSASEINTGSKSR